VPILDAFPAENPIYKEWDKAWDGKIFVIRGFPDITIIFPHISMTKICQPDIIFYVSINLHCA
jgi:hypothetical protein